jgi:porin
MVRPAIAAGCRACLAAIAALGLCDEPAARPQEVETGQETGVPFLVSEPDLGRWPLLDRLFVPVRDVRAYLRERGVALEGVLLADVSLVAAGGADPGGAAARALLDVSLDVDLERFVGIPGAHLHVGFEAQGGEDGSEDVGDLQRFSEIDLEEGRVQLARAWWEQRLLDDRLRARLGKMDANDLFAHAEHAQRFLHASTGYSPTILSFPTYPDPAFGAALLVAPKGPLGLRAGVFDGALQEGVRTGEHDADTLFGEPSDLFLVGEVGVRWEPAGGGARGRLGAGAWRHTGTFARFAGGEDEGTEGAYLVLDQELWRDRGGPRRLAGFAQLGVSDPEVALFDRHVGGGLVWSGLGRGRDALGVGASWARFSREAGLSGEGELALELFYGFYAASWLRLTPDVQYIANPGGVAGREDALVLTLRATLVL